MLCLVLSDKIGAINPPCHIISSRHSASAGSHQPWGWTVVGGQTGPGQAGSRDGEWNGHSSNVMNDVTIPLASAPPHIRNLLDPDDDDDNGKNNAAKRSRRRRGHISATTAIAISSPSPSPSSPPHLRHPRHPRHQLYHSHFISIIISISSPSPPPPPALPST